MRGFLRAVAAAVVAISVAALCAGPKTQPAKRELRPSVLVITLDTARADRLGCYGNRDGLTPNLDKLAKRGHLFENCEAPTPYTFPSHASIFSGWDPNRHGVRQNFDVRLPASVPLLQQEFQRAGYATGAFVSSIVLKGYLGLGRGFQLYEDRLWNRRSAEETLALAQRWLTAQKTGSFCWVHLFDPHYPYRPPEPFASKHKGKPYDGCIAYMDWALGSFFKSLEQSGYLDGALVVVCSDHGEGLGDHGEPLHGIFLYEATTRSPLIVKLPGQAKGSKIGQDVGLVDIAPTIRNICRLPEPGSDGVSLDQLLLGKPFSRKPVYIETMVPFQEFGWAPLFALVEKRQKYILAPKPELYDLSKDPSEKSNLADQNKRRAQEMKARLANYISSTKVQKPECAAAGQEELKALQGLGYIGGSSEVAPADTSKLRDPKDSARILGLIKAANDCVAENRLRDAATKIEGILRLDPKNSIVAFMLGDCLERLQDYKGAAKYLEMAIRLRPTYPQPYIHLMGVYIAEDKPDEALKWGHAYLKGMEDHSGEIRTLMAWALYRSGRPEREVLSELAAAEKIGPARPRAYMLRALMELDKGKKEGALRQLESMAGVCDPSAIAALESDPWFKKLRKEPGFISLVARAKKGMAKG